MNSDITHPLLVFQSSKGVWLWWCFERQSVKPHFSFRKTDVDSTWWV